MIAYAVYGKIIIDNIRLSEGSVVRGVLGGGGPQGAFGARLWSDSVGFLSRSGSDIPPDAADMLRGLDIDLGGWVKYEDLATFRGGLAYDEQQLLLADNPLKAEMPSLPGHWDAMLSRPIALPETYRAPRAIHLITEYYDEPMVKDALALRAAGAVFSLEPIIDYRKWTNREQMLSLFPQVDIVTPDWPSASGIAGSADPKQVMQKWTKFGAPAVAVRHSQYGSYVWDCAHDQIWHIPAVPVQVVDPTGAGNSYGGGWCVGWTETREARRAGCYGAVSASFLVRQVGLPKMSPALQREAHKLYEPTLRDSNPL
jgi:sugar/nucleoside kinase (ribokinase family)